MDIQRFSRARKFLTNSPYTYKRKFVPVPGKTFVSKRRSFKPRRPGRPGGYSLGTRLRQKKFGAAKMTEYFSWADLTPNLDTAVKHAHFVGHWAYKSFDLTPYIRAMVTLRNQKTTKGYQVRWLKVNLMKQRGCPYPFYGFFTADDALTVIARCKDNGLKAGVKSLGRRLVVNPRQLFNRFHGEYPQIGDSGLAMAEHGFKYGKSINLFIVYPPTSWDSSIRAESGGAPGNVLAAPTSVTNDEKDTRYMDFFDLKLTIGFVRTSD